MSRFVRLKKLAPVDQFISDLLISRAALGEAYLNAWNATKKANRLQNESLYAQFTEADDGDPFGVSWLHAQAPSVNDEVLNREAQEQDRRADLQAMLTIHCADQSLRRLGFALKIKPDRMARGFGKLFNEVPLTSLLCETMNCAST